MTADHIWSVLLDSIDTAFHPNNVTPTSELSQYACWKSLIKGMWSETSHSILGWDMDKCNNIITFPCHCKKQHLVNIINSIPSHQHHISSPSGKDSWTNYAPCPSPSLASLASSAFIDCKYYGTSGGSCKTSFLPHQYHRTFPAAAVCSWAP